MTNHDTVPPSTVWSSAGSTDAAEAATVDAAFPRVRDLHGVEVLAPLLETDIGSRTFDVRDGDGNLRSVGSYPGERHADVR